jgi:hypothetical protein
MNPEPVGASSESGVLCRERPPKEAARSIDKVTDIEELRNLGK